MIWDMVEIAASAVENIIIVDFVGKYLGYKNQKIIWLKSGLFFVLSMMNVIIVLIDKETMGREIRWKKPKLPVNDREKWRNRAVCKHKEMQLNKKSAESGCQSLSALFCC